MIYSNNVLCFQLKRSQIINFNENDYEINLLMSTKGQGVLVVLSSLCGPDLHKSLHCLARHGRFIQLDKTDLENREKIGKKTCIFICQV